MRLIGAFLTLLFLTVPPAALAQAPAPAELPAVAAAPDTPPPFREGSVDFSFIAATGNSESQTIGLAGDLIVRPDGWEIRNRAGFIRAESDDELTAEAFYYNFRAARALTPRLRLYGQYDYLRDTFAGIDHRNVVTGGLDYLLLDRAPHRLSAFAGLGYLNEQRVTGDDISTAVFNAGWAYRLRISESAEFTDDFRWDQSLSDGQDWRIGHTAALTAKLTTLLSLKVSNNIRFVNAPPPGFEKTDSITAVALVAKF
jgi:putative salt-induced outer membrane protein YdiY